MVGTIKQEEPTAKRIKTEDSAKPPPENAQPDQISSISNAAASESDTTIHLNIDNCKVKQPMPDTTSSISSAAASESDTTIQVKLEEDSVKQEQLPVQKERSSEASHFREDCPIHPFSEASFSQSRIFCDDCLCYVCNLPASQCKSWGCESEHMSATKSSAYWQNTRAEYLKIQAWHKNPVIDLFERDCKQPRRLTEERCRAAYFYYPDKAGFEKALHCYNIQSFICSKDPYEDVFNYRQSRSFARKPILGSHKTPCADCGTSFVIGRDLYYWVDLYRSPYSGPTKYCLGCMGRIVAFHTSPIAQGLQKKLEEEEARIGAIKERCEESWRKEKEMRRSSAID